MSKQEAARWYPNQPIQFSHFLKDWHRNKWMPGDWTDDTDQMILIMDNLFAHGGLVDPVDFAKRLLFWIHHGFPELGDTTGHGLGNTVFRVSRHADFTKDPHKAAHEVYEMSEGFAAANGGVMRTSVLGIPHFHDLSKVIENTKTICKVTHADPRCLASAVVCTTAIAMMLQGYDVSSQGFSFYRTET
jgi:ADP-ribosylglycohydrolase